MIFATVNLVEKDGLIQTYRIKRSPDIEIDSLHPPASIPQNALEHETDAEILQTYLGQGDQRQYEQMLMG